MGATSTSKRRARRQSRAARRISDPALLVAAVVATASAPASVTLTSKAPSKPAVCAGVARCHVVARADVNGDGKKDVIGIARRGSDEVPRGAVVVRVETAPGKISSYRAPTEFWLGPPWQGAARLDGRKGSELMVGFTTGAHSESFRSITWRKGRLVTLDAPGPDRYWYIDGAVWISAGWQRRASDPVGTIRERVATRNTADPTVSPFKGKVTSYRWKAGGWRKTGSKTYPVLSDATAATWGGFQVPGLDRW